MRTTSSIIVSYDASENGDEPILLVGKKNPNETIKIINAFQGKEAKDLWKKLTERNEKIG